MGKTVISKLSPRIQSYAWGSRTVLAQLTGRSTPTEHAEAELWMGAHEAAPSGIDGTTLDNLVAANPIAVLGDSCALRFGCRFPYLLKVLVAEQVLSIQCHPDATQVQEAPVGTYTDIWPKPEALVAVTPYEIFAGTRSSVEAVAVLRAFEVPELNALIDAANGADVPVKHLLAALLHLDEDCRKSLVYKVIRVCSAGVSDETGTVDAVLRIAEQYPGDIGLVVLLTMVHRVLQPGEYIFVPAGVLHAYVCGTCVEILANSNNVVRAGLTPKAVNIDELLRIVDVDRTMIPQSASGDRVRSFPVDAPYFQLHVVDSGADPLPLPGNGCPRIALALDNSVVIECAEGSLQLAPGESCFLDAAAPSATAAGTGRLYLATTG